MTSMNRMDILEAMYEVIKNSTECGIDCKDGCYGQYVDGVIAMTDAMLEKDESLLNCDDSMLM